MYVDAGAALAADRHATCQQLHAAVAEASYSHALPGSCPLTGELGPTIALQVADCSPDCLSPTFCRLQLVLQLASSHQRQRRQWSSFSVLPALPHPVAGSSRRVAEMARSTCLARLTAGQLRPRNKIVMLMRVSMCLLLPLQDPCVACH